MAFHCRDCNEDHEGLPDLGSDAPDPYLWLPKVDRDASAALTPDRCTITRDDGHTDYFIRGVIFIPVHGEAQPWGIGVWISQSEANYQRYLDDEEEMEPTFGWLATRLSFYEKDTLALKTCAHFSNDKTRPTIELEPTDHPLAVDQREGITLEKAWKIVHRYMN
jgi:hypothetical protein